MSQHPLRPNTPLRKATSSKEKQDLNLDRAYRAWLASREGVPHRKNSLAPGGQRSFNCANAQHAMTITKHCAYDFCNVLITLHPGRTTLMLCLNVIRSLSPAYRGYWQAVALNEVRASRTTILTRNLTLHQHSCKPSLPREILVGFSSFDWLRASYSGEFQKACLNHLRRSTSNKATTCLGF